MRWPAWIARYGTSFSFVGLAFAAVFFALSLTPSLLPRTPTTQGVLSGIALAVGYGVGVLVVLLWLYMELPPPPPRLERISRRVTAAVVLVVVAVSLWRATIWQNSIRGLMEMEPLETAAPFSVALTALLVGAVLLIVARLLGRSASFVARQLDRVLPRRVSFVLGVAVVGYLTVTLVSGFLARRALDAADATFSQLDALVDEGVEAPADAWASGGPDSLIPWDTIGRQGKGFIVSGPTREELSDFRGRPARQPLRVFVGLHSRQSARQRAQLALAELKRVGGFERSVLVVATPTGTGWLDPGAVDTLEYIHGGDTAIVTVQYSYLPSWITILVKPDRPREAARLLFDEVYTHWCTLPRESRPKLYLHGLSLGSLGSETSADLFAVFEDPIQGALWSGPPFPSRVWKQRTRERNPGSPAWLPTFRDGSLLRFTSQTNTLDEPDRRWGPMRFVYLQYASDPMVFFREDMAFRAPAWLVGERGPDVSPYLRWVPIVTFLQVAFDIPMATTVPTGYGHNYAPADYIDAWVAVTEPESWTAADTARLKVRFADVHPRP
jgi:uncharacterized membrane protein